MLRTLWWLSAIFQLYKCEVIVDLGHIIDSNDLYYPVPGLKPFELTTVVEGYNFFVGENIWVSTKKFCGPEHSGTHIDAPFHFARDGWKIHEIPVEHFIAQAVVIDVREKVRTNSDYELSAEDVEEFIGSYGQLPNNSVVLVHTGWSSRYHDRAMYYGHGSDSSKFASPGIGITASNFLLSLKESEGIHVVGVGIDAGSLDKGSSRTFPTHIALLEANLYGIENMNNLAALPPRGIELLVMPMNIREGSGAPSRVLARIGSDAVSVTLNILLAISCLVLLGKIAY